MKTTLLAMLSRALRDHHKYFSHHRMELLGPTQELRRASRDGTAFYGDDDLRAPERLKNGSAQAAMHGEEVQVSNTTLRKMMLARSGKPLRTGIQGRGR